jgi:DNA repair protein RAD50
MEAQSLKASVAELARFKREIDTNEEEMRALTSSMAGMAGTRTVEELRDNLQQLNDEAKRTKSSIEKMRQDKENRSQTIIVLGRQVDDARKRLNDIRLQLVRARAITDQIEGFHESRHQQCAIIDQVERELASLSPEIMAAEARLKEISRECSDKENKQQRDATKLSDSDRDLRIIQQRILDFINDGGLSKLDTCKKQVQRLKAEVEQLGKDVTQCGEEISKLEKDSANTSATEHTIIENLRYRKNKAELQTIEDEIKELESQRAEEQRDRFTRDLKILSNNLSRLSGEVRVPRYTQDFWIKLLIV